MISRTIAVATLAMADALVTRSAGAKVDTRHRPVVSNGASLPVVDANDNRRPAGTMRGETLFVSLDVRMARWFPESAAGQFIDAPVMGEVGRSPQIPGPLLRVRQGTHIVAHLTNALTDSIVTWYGLSSRPGMDSVVLRPGASTIVRFAAGRPGTYVYTADAGHVDRPAREREQLTAAFVVDAAGARTDDRIFVMNIWGDPTDSVTYRNALTINGRAWPFTERVEATQGDTLRWRIVNGTNRPHPMHLHGFYYQITASGDGARDSLFRARDYQNVVTELMPPYSTMAMSFVAAREGNWLFHCHLSFHVSPDARFETSTSHVDHTSGDASRHMAGLVLGLHVKPSAASRAPHEEPRLHPRALRLLVQEGPRRGRSLRALGYVLQEHDAIAADSASIPGTPLILTRGQPTDITVVNHLSEPTAVHWHGIELESFSDGVAGWSGMTGHLAPTIAPRDSFTAHLTLRRAGTFIYHTHLNDVEQLTSGLYGAIVVLEPNARYDAATDHLFVVGWDGQQDPPHLLVNGDSLPPTRVFRAGVHHRLRFVFIGAVGGEVFTLRSSTGVVRWRTLARDGFALTRSRQRDEAASVQGWAGQTFDFDFLPPTPGEYTLIAGEASTPTWVGRIVVK